MHWKLMYHLHDRQSLTYSSTCFIVYKWIVQITQATKSLSKYWSHKKNRYIFWLMMFSHFLISRWHYSERDKIPQVSWCLWCIKYEVLDNHALHDRLVFVLYKLITWDLCIMQQRLSDKWPGIMSPHGVLQLWHKGTHQLKTLLCYYWILNRLS